MSAVRLTGALGGAGVFSVPSRSREGVAWRVTWSPPAAHCGCPDHGFRWRWCWHIRQAAAEVGLEVIREELDCG